MDLDVTGRKFWVVCALFARADLALNGDNEFAANVLCLSMCRGVRFRADNDLCQPLAVAKIDKCQRPKITLLRDPAHQNDLTAGMALTQLTARMRPFQIS